MAIDFGSLHWSDEIAEISTQPEYQTADIELYDPSNYDPDLYDVETGEYSGPAPIVFYEGQARVIGVRWGVESSYTQANSATISAVRVQIPQHATGFVKRGVFVRFTAAPKNPALVNRIFRITSDLQGASAAARTFEAALDGDAVAS